jgi:hypothetical protein
LNRPFKFFHNLLLTLTNTHFYWVATSVDYSHSPTATIIALPLTFTALHYAIVQGAALEITGWQIVPLFHPANTGKFLLLPLESRNCDSRRTPITYMYYTPVTGGSQTEQQIQADLECHYTDSHWSE